MPHPKVSDEIVVYAREGPELRDFLALVERFNRRALEPTRWRPLVITSSEPLARLCEERRGDVVVLAGRNGGKARTIERLHEAGLHVLADKPWLVHPDDLPSVRASLAGWPLAMEIMTGRHDLAARLLKRLVDAPEILGRLRPDGPAIELDSVHQLEKLVDGAPLRRPWWFFDVRIQGSGAVDIPTHLVDQTQWILQGLTDASPTAPRLLSARAWPTHVPLESFRRITGCADVPPELQPLTDGEGLRYLCNAELVYRLGDVTARASTRWELRPPPGGQDAYRVVVHGTRADVGLEQGAHTGGQRRLVIEPRTDPVGVARALTHEVAGWARDYPGLRTESDDGGRSLIAVPTTLDPGHETHFARVLDQFLHAIDGGQWPADLAARTLAKYTLLADAAAVSAPPVTAAYAFPQ